MRIIAAVCVLTVGCGSRTIAVSEDAARIDSSAADQSVTAPSPDLARHDVTVAPFCSGNPKLVIDGETLTVSQVEGEVIAMGCCDGSAMKFIAGDAEGRTVTVWAGIRVVCCGKSPPHTLDLGQLDEDWEVIVAYSPCAPLTSCHEKRVQLTSLAEDHFEGTAELNGEGFYDGLKLSLCLEGRAGPDSDGLRSVRLFARDVEIAPAL